MIKFVDIREQDIGFKFSFWDSYAKKYVKINDDMAWCSWKEFVKSCVPDVDAIRFRSLCPNWVTHDDSNLLNEALSDNRKLRDALNIIARWGLPEDIKLRSDKERNFIKKVANDALWI